MIPRWMMKLKKSLLHPVLEMTIKMMRTILEIIPSKFNLKIKALSKNKLIADLIDGKL